MTIAMDDRAFRLGDGLFETVRVEPRGPLALAWHIARFRRSARELGFLSSSIEAGVAALDGLQSAAPGIWRVTVSRDDPSAPFGTLSGGNAQRVILARSLDPSPTVLLAVRPSHRRLGIGLREGLGPVPVQLFVRDAGAMGTYLSGIALAVTAVVLAV